MMTKEMYLECHGTDDLFCKEDDGEILCTNCGRDILIYEDVFEVNDDVGHDIICMDCLKRMSIYDLANLFGASLTKVIK